MPNTHTTLTSLFSDIADAIREKTGDSADIVADEFPDAIAAIPTGGDTGVYGGEYIPASYPASTSEHYVFNAPNCSHFVICLAETPALDTAQSFLGGGYADKTLNRAFQLSSNNAGSIFPNGSGAGLGFYENETRLASLNVVFGANTVELQPQSVAATSRLLQAGTKYVWYAW